MGSKRVSTSDLSQDLYPRPRSRVERSRKRFQCDLLAFWRLCQRPGCRQHHRCVGDPHDCFRRHHAAMPGNHKSSRVAALMSKTTGIGTVEQQLRAAGASVPRRLRRAPPPRRADRAAPPVLAQESEASLQARRKAEILARVALRGMASLEKELKEIGMTVLEIPRPAGAAPSRQADRGARPAAPAGGIAAERQNMRKIELLARVATASFERDLNELGFGIARRNDWRPETTVARKAEPDLVEWEPMKGSSIDPIRMPGRLPPPPDPRSAPATPAAPAEADAGTARPPRPTRPPGVAPWQAWHDDEGRLHMPDPADVNEHYRMLTRAEVEERMRAYGRSL